MDIGEGDSVASMARINADFLATEGEMKAEPDEIPVNAEGPETSETTDEIENPDLDESSENPEIPEDEE